MDHTADNLECLKMLQQFVEANPHLRLEQILFNLDINEDHFYEDPKVTKERWKSKLKSN